jgi:CRISPR system Cascade subunit CasC
MDNAFGAPLARRFLALDPVEIAGVERINLAKLADWAHEVVRQGVC